MSQPAYFVDHKRGEVNELKALLRNERVVRDPIKKREVIKKVIAYMTLGIDVSRLFSEMIMACHTKDLVQKKMVYLYLCTYAEQKADLAILAINTLHKDVRDEDPMVRGLALRSLCSLRLPNIVEYALQPIRQRLNDPSPYVRKTAVMGVAKLFTRHPEVVKGKDSDLVDVLYNMLRDKDAQVVTNVILALNEVLADEGEMAINAQIIMHLLNRLAEFHEWGQCAVLTLVARYIPASDKEMFDIMNVLEERLRHSNSAVVLGVTKVFLNFTVNNSQLHLQVYQRLKAPLLTLMTSGSFELAFCVLSHVKLLVDKAPGVFDDEFKHLFCRYNDPTCVKLLKLDILQNLANGKNYSDLLAELREYVTDVDVEIARKAIQGIAFIAIKLKAAVDEAVESLLSFLDLNMDYVTAEACIVMKNLLRKYPELYEDVIPALQKCIKTIDEEEGKVAVIWMIGEYGDTIKDAPYILEPLIDNFAEEPSHAVRMELLTSALKLFFKRPPELKQMLGKLLKAAVEDTSQIDVRDRALLYYRLLKYDVQEAARVVHCPKVIVESFIEQEDQAVKDQIFKEFNSLSLIYSKPAKLFVTGVDMEEELKREEESRKKKAAEDQQENSASSSLVRDQDRDKDAPIENDKDIVKVPKIQPKQQSEIDILAMDLLDMPSKVASPGATRPTLNLRPQPVMDGGTFQAKWTAVPVGGTLELLLSNPKLDPAVIESSLAVHSIMTIASGTVENIIKLYLYAQNADNGDFFFIETVVDSNTGRLVSTVKADTRLNPQEATAPLLAILREALEL